MPRDATPPALRYYPATTDYVTTVDLVVIATFVAYYTFVDVVTLADATLGSVLPGYSWDRPHNDTRLLPVPCPAHCSLRFPDATPHYPPTSRSPVTRIYPRLRYTRTFTPTPFYLYGFAVITPRWFTGWTRPGRRRRLVLYPTFC